MSQTNAVLSLWYAGDNRFEQHGKHQLVPQYGCSAARRYATIVIIAAVLVRMANGLRSFFLLTCRMRYPTISFTSS